MKLPKFATGCSHSQGVAGDGACGPLSGSEIVGCARRNESVAFSSGFQGGDRLTPKAYASAHRARRLREQLSGCRNVTEAIYDAGFNSNSRLYEEYYALLGMRPQDYRKGGRNAEIRFAIVQASLGTVLVAMSQWGVCAIDLGNKPEDMVRELENQFPTGTSDRRRPRLECFIAR